MERNSRDTFLALQEILAGLYSAERDARIIASDAGLSTSKIMFSSHPLHNWHSILTEATVENRVAELLQVVMAEYPENQVLSELYTQYRNSAYQLHSDDLVVTDHLYGSYPRIKYSRSYAPSPYNTSYWRQLLYFYQPDFTLIVATLGAIALLMAIIDLNN